MNTLLKDQLRMRVRNCFGRELKCDNIDKEKRLDNALVKNREKKCSNINIPVPAGV